MTKAKRRRHLSAFENSLFLFIRIAGEGGILPRPRLRASRSVHFSTEKYFCRLTTTVATGFTRGGISSSVSEAINFATGVSRFYALRVHFACSYIPGKLNFFYTPRGILHSTVVNFLRRFSFSLSLSLSLSLSQVLCRSWLCKMLHESPCSRGELYYTIGDILQLPEPRLRHQRVSEKKRNCIWKTDCT